MRTITLSLLVLGLVPALAAAGVYKWVDPDGTVHFSDTPQPGAEEVHVPPPQMYTPAPYAPITPRPEAPAAQAEYTQLAITAPEAEASIWDNTGAIPVSFSLKPALKADRGHRLVVLVDGQAQEPVKGTSTTLENVERGSHTLQGQIVDAAGKVLVSSSAITVHLHRQSVLGPNRARPPAP